MTEISDAKSEVGLGEIYEREYMDMVRVKEGMGTAADEKLQAQHASIATLFAALCHSLDSLSNFHFTPRPPKETELTIVTKAPAIALEEVIPMGVSDAQLKAPQEVLKPSAAAKHADGPAASTELTHEERQRLHRAKKRKAHKKQASKREEESARAAAQGPNSKAAKRLADKKAIASISSARNVKIAAPVTASKGKLTNSTIFFSQMQDAKTVGKKSTTTVVAAAGPAKQFKL